jgi:hypothetical protein
VTDDAFAGDTPPAAKRGNGLSADAWVSVCDVDPRLAEPILEALAEASLPAYVAPSTGSVGHYLEVRLPDRPADRLWVDAARRSEAEEIVSTVVPELHASMEDERWADIVKSLSSTDEEPAWSDAKRSLSERSADAAPNEVVRPEPDDDDHFVPPDPPWQPLDHPVTRYGWIALLGGCLLLLIPALIGATLSTGWLLIAVAAIAGGFITLIMRMKDSPPTDSGPDDGAVV